MATSELVVWCAMLGGLFTLAAMAISDVFVSRSVGSWRGLIFIVLTGTSCALMTGLPEFLLPELPAIPVLVFKVSLGPLCGALALTYLGLWLGVAAEDPVVHYTIVWGSTLLVVAALFLAGLSLGYSANDAADLMVLTATISCVAVLLATLASVRAALLGDRLARWMVLACLFLALMIAGLYSHALQPDGLGLGLQILTAFSTVSYFLIVTSLSIRRGRMNRRLERLAGLAQGVDPATGLPKGSILLSKVDDAFWRSARMNTQCAVICLHLRNLYELGEVAGHHVDQQILAALTARVRRAVGFRSVVGLYHPRCFVVVVSSIKHPKLVLRTVSRLRYLMAKPLGVVGMDEGHHTFSPRFSIGIVMVTASIADPAAVIDEAERMALASDLGPLDQPPSESH
jgi:GGDEF domain-containing protein